MTVFTFSAEDSERALAILQTLLATSDSVMWRENLDGLLVLLESLACDLKLQMVIYYQPFVVLTC